MARLDYVRPGSSEEADLVFAEVQRLDRPVLNLYAELANHPDALEAFLGMSNFVRDRSKLDAHTRELSILATAQVLDQQYELVQHRAVAARSGVLLQTFDYVSLLTCFGLESSGCGPVPMPAHGFADLMVTRTGPWEVRLDPSPFAGEELRVDVTCVRLPVERFGSDAELRSTYRDAARERQTTAYLR